MDKLIIKNALAAASGSENTDIGEEMRVHYVNGCKYGGSVIYNFGRALPTKWNEYCVPNGKF